jgi:hypothetical protein
MTTYADLGYHTLSPSEVLARARREGRVKASPAPPKPTLPPPPWWYTEYLDERSTEIGVGEGRALAAAAALREACRALGISKYDLPPLRFASRPPTGAPDDLPAWFKPSLLGGTVCVVARQSLLATAKAVVHETVHYHQSRELGPLVDIGREVANSPSHPLERQARSAHRDFERYLEQAWAVTTRSSMSNACSTGQSKYFTASLVRNGRRRPGCDSSGSPFFSWQGAVRLPFTGGVLLSAVRRFINRPATHLRRRS